MIISIIGAYLWIGCGVTLIRELIRVIGNVKCKSAFDGLRSDFLCIIAWWYYITIDVYAGYRWYKRKQLKNK